MPGKSLKRNHSVGDLSVENVELICSSAGKKLKKLRSQTQREQPCSATTPAPLSLSQSQSESEPLNVSQTSTISKLLETVIDSVASGTTTKVGTVENGILESQMRDEGRSASLDAMNDIVDNKTLRRIITQSIVAEIAPLLAIIASMQSDMQQLKDVVNKMSSVIMMRTQVADFATTSDTSANAAVVNVVNQSQISNSSQLLRGSEDLMQQQQKPAATRSYATTAAARSKPVKPTSQVRQNNDHKPGEIRGAQHDAVAAMYVDLNRKQRRSSNIVICGMPTSDCDEAAVEELLRSEFSCDTELWPGVSIARCKRLGKLQENKVQPILVVLKYREQAEYFVKNARYLRSSNNAEVRKNVYINADLTPSEARAAYELRAMKKQRAQRDHSAINQNQSTGGRLFYRTRDPTNYAAVDNVRPDETRSANEQMNQTPNDEMHTISLKWRSTATSSANQLTTSEAATAATTSELGNESPHRMVVTAEIHSSESGRPPNA